jgi:hypothetical protein
MKDLKIFYLIAFALLLFTFPYSCSDQKAESQQIETDIDLEVRSGGIGESCLPEISCPGGVYSWPIEIDMFPGCIFPVKVDYKRCLAGQSVHLYLGEFEILYDELYCDDYYDYLEVCMLNGTLEECIIEINQLIWEQVTLNILNGSNLNTQVHHTFEYYVGACKFLCESEVLDCAEQGIICCKKEYVYAFDQNSREWFVYWEGPSQLIGNGECPDTPLSSCPGNVLQTVNCFDNCASLDFFN